MKREFLRESLSLLHMVYIQMRIYLLERRKRQRILRWKSSVFTDTISDMTIVLIVQTVLWIGNLVAAGWFAEGWSCSPTRGANSAAYMSMHMLTIQIIS